MKPLEFDVAIIGGGPAGSTVGALLKKYNPSLDVAIFEREMFPRDHIGESLLPPISAVLDEMGVWDKIEAADFPIKLGATYRWGKRPELWHFDFYPPDQFQPEARPAPYAGQRVATAFQVDRSIYDEILLDHAAELGCVVRQGTKVARVDVEDKRVTGLQLESGDRVHARYYIDASGNSGILRRSLSIQCDYPSTLKNVAIYDYWQNAEWAVEIGVGGTRIQVLTVGYGWIWFIPLGPTRTSIGLVIPAEHLKRSGQSPEELYRSALAGEARVAKLLENAESEGKLQTTRDWSFLAERQVGENWFLIGECAGFADPILSAGVTMAHIAARQAAYTILGLDRKQLDPDWLRDEFQRRQSQRIRTHIRFGDYWYTANEQFLELKEFTTKLAMDIGLELGPEKAWDWIARGGFIDEDLRVGSGGFSLSSIKAMSGKLSDLEAPSVFDTYNVFKLDLSGASWKDRAAYLDGRITQTPAYVRGDRVLPIEHHVEAIVTVLQSYSDATEIAEVFRGALESRFEGNDEVDSAQVERHFQEGMSVLEAMVTDGWLKCSLNPSRPMYRARLANDRPIHWESEAVAESATAAG